MAEMIPGTFLECIDEATAQYVIYLNMVGIPDKNGDSQKFILREIDETHLFIKAEFVREVLKKMDEFSDSNAFNPVGPISTEGGVSKRKTNRK